MRNTPKIPLIQTKLRIPSLRKTIVDRRFFAEDLDESSVQGLVLLSTPAGYGKTTVLADWARKNPKGVGWLTLEKTDNDLEVFNHYFEALIDNATEACHGAGINASSVEDEETRLHHMVINLTNQCTNLDGQITLILDDYQKITNEQIHQEIAFLLAHLPPNLRLVLLTRKEPPFSLAKLRASNQILEIRANEMEMNLVETSEFLRDTRGLTVSDEDLLYSSQRTAGWITGLQLLTPAQLRETTETNDHFRQPHFNLALHNYFLDEVLKEESPDVQEFLLKASVLKEFNESLCDHLMGHDQESGWSGEMIRTLFAHNLFCFPVVVGSDWCYFHPLFAEFLQVQLDKHFPDAKRELAIKASEWFEDHGLLKESLNQVYAIKDTGLIVDCLEKITIKFITEGKILELTELISTTDEKLLELTPLLSLAHAWDLLTTYDFESSAVWLEKAYLLAQTPDGMKRIETFRDTFFGILKMIESILDASRGEVNQAEKLANEAVALLPQGNDFVRGLTLMNHALMHNIEGKYSEAITLYNETIQIGQKSGNWFMQISSRLLLGRILEECGRFTDAMMHLERSRAVISRLQGKFRNFDSFICKEMAIIHTVRNELVEAEEDFQGYLDSQPVLRISTEDVSAHLCLARFHHANNDPGGAQLELNFARQLSLSSESAKDDLLVDMAELEIDLQHNKVENAEKWFRRYGNSSVKMLPFTVRIDAQLLWARLLLIQGRQEKNSEKFYQSRETLEALLPALEEIGLMVHKIKLYILRALIAYELGEKENILAALREALSLAETEEIRQVFLDEGVIMSRLLITYMAAVKQNLVSRESPSLTFVSDLSFRFTGRTGDNKAGLTVLELEAFEDQLVVELLTARETEVLELVARGRSNSEIAQDLCISINTVKRHLNNVFMKLGVNTRVQAIRVARQRGLLP